MSLSLKTLRTVLFFLGQNLSVQAGKTKNERAWGGKGRKER